MTILNKKKKETGITELAAPKLAEGTEMKTSTTSKIESKVSPKLLISILLIVIAFVVAYFGGYNQYLGILKIKDSTVEENKNLDKLSAQKEYLKSLADDRAELEGRQKLAQQAVPLSDDISDLMNQVIEMAKTTGIELTDLSFSGLGNGEESTDFKKVVLRSTAKGTFSQLVSFVNHIENSRRILVIDSLTYDPAASDVDDVSQKYTLSLNLTGFYYPEIDVKSLTIDQLAKPTDLTDIVIRLRSYRYYSVDDTIVNIGNNENPFQIEPITNNPSNDVTETPVVETKAPVISNDNGGISPN